MPDALQLLREDHNRVKEMFQRFEKSEAASEKKEIANTAIMELMVHAQIEEEIFYPALKKQLGDVMMLHEAEQEHHVAEVLMDELQTMRLNDKTFEAKFMVLAENVKHHIDEEEGELFPKAAEAGMPRLNEVGDRLQARKMELMKQATSPSKRRTTTASRNGGSRGRTTRTTARSRTTTSARGGAKATKKRTTTRSSAAKRTTTSSKRASTGTRTGTRSTSGTRTSRATKSTTGRSAAARSRSGGESRARNASKKRSTAAKRGSSKTTSRSRR